MSNATDAYERLLADQQRNALIPPRPRDEVEKERKIEAQTYQIRRATKSKAPA